MLHVKHKKIIYKKCNVFSPTIYTRTGKPVPTTHYSPQNPTRECGFFMRTGFKRLNPYNRM